MNRKETLRKCFSIAAAGIVMATPSFVKAAESTPARIVLSKNEYSRTDAFNNRIIYNPNAIKQNLILGIGDSNMWGSPHKGPGVDVPESYLSSLKDKVKTEWGYDWRITNWGTPGWPTEKVIEQMESPG